MALDWQNAKQTDGTGFIFAIVYFKINVMGLNTAIFLPAMGTIWLHL
jgi:hypothetical protein